MTIGMLPDVVKPGFHYVRQNALCWRAGLIGGVKREASAVLVRLVVRRSADASGLNLPASLAGLLAGWIPGFIAFPAFCGLVAGLCGQVRRRTVCGMLLGAGLSRCWPHDRAHYFFARAAGSWMNWAWRWPGRP